jgi:hypothetical protein
MSEIQIKIGMRPPHPGMFFRDEILEERGFFTQWSEVILEIDQRNSLRGSEGGRKLIE